jgi:hypothetical protein
MLSGMFFRGKQFFHSTRKMRNRRSVVRESPRTLSSAKTWAQPSSGLSSLVDRFPVNAWHPPSPPLTTGLMSSFLGTPSDAAEAALYSDRRLTFFDPANFAPTNFLENFSREPNHSLYEF